MTLFYNAWYIRIYYSPIRNYTLFRKGNTIIMNSEIMTTTTKKLSTKNIILIGMFASIQAIISQLSLPMPNGMPITIQVFGITLLGVVLGWKLGFFSTIVYILIGCIGIPVFAGYRGGIGVLANMTGGYILSYPLMVIFCGIKFKFSKKYLNLFFTIVFSIIGLLITEAIGGLQWAALSGDMSVKAVFIYSITAFIPKDMLLTILGVIIGIQIRKPLVKLGYLS